MRLPANITSVELGRELVVATQAAPDKPADRQTWILGPYIVKAETSDGRMFIEQGGQLEPLLDRLRAFARSAA